MRTAFWNSTKKYDVLEDQCLTYKMYTLIGNFLNLMGEQQLFQLTLILDWMDSYSYVLWQCRLRQGYCRTLQIFNFYGFLQIFYGYIDWFLILKGQLDIGNEPYLLQRWIIVQSDFWSSPDRQTDRKWRIWAHCTKCTGGLKNGFLWIF